MQNHKLPLRTKTVLVVDDDLAVRVVVARMLQDEGYAVRMAPSAPAALLMLAAAPGAVDLIVADVRMPDMNGLDLAVEVRRSWPEIPIGLMSGHLPEELGSTHRELAGLPFLRKPFGAAGLIELVDALAAGARHALAAIAFAGGP